MGTPSITYNALLSEDMDLVPRITTRVAPPTPEEEALKPKKVKSEGEIPSPVNVPSGCSFHTRCAFKQKICMEVDPEMQEVEPGHFVRCHLCGKCK